jgi:hypothetical protein
MHRISKIYIAYYWPEKILSERLAPAAGKEHDKTAETASLNSGQ